MKKRSPTKRGRSGRRASRKAGATAGGLQGLADRFARFRARHAPGSRIPAELRSEVLGALRQGVSFGEVKRSCGVSWSQIQAWEAAQSAETIEPPGSVEESVRTFTVVDEAEVLERDASASTLELRLGPWSIKVGRVEAGIGVGGSACSR